MNEELSGLVLGYKMVQNMFRTGFLVRATHTVLTWVITLILFVHNTDLRQCEERGELMVPVLFFLLVVLSVLLYFAVSLMDPGFVLADTVKPSDLESESMMPQSSTCRLRRCGFCLLQQPMRAKHCPTCCRCVRRFDHHCPWIENCVGERNHRWFVLYLMVQLLTLLWALHVAFCYNFRTSRHWETVCSCPRLNTLHSFFPPLWLVTNDVYTGNSFLLFPLSIFQYSSGSASLF
ncbi:palmitoyltransferase ZDHHC12-B-like isoform X2 [Phycodurus eques]|uniref:palmitoyltransferase ZDHHC12-B-like isoform X2 n=1 Tax=Phycodurus eques TaxID=693459 RepID=UPI002ACEFF14|nr:palmitoyltransferase ZDHHC12-B-like isoform X2 [Phycodurus eques]